MTLNLGLCGQCSDWKLLQYLCLNMQMIIQKDNPIPPLFHAFILFDLTLLLFTLTTPLHVNDYKTNICNLTLSESYFLHHIRLSSVSVWNHHNLLDIIFQNLKITTSLFKQIL